MRSLRGYRRLKFLITAGGTREYIDPVRFISNASSGKTGNALARAALQGGHDVTLISAATDLPPMRGAKVIRVQTAEEMFKAVRGHFAECDCLIMAAAVADYTPARAAKTKIKKGMRTFVLRLKPTADILKWAGMRKKKGQVVVGFALEDRKIRANAERKLRDKKLDMVVANTPATVGSERCEVLVRKAGDKWRRIAKAPKRQVAGRLIRMIEQLVWMD